MIRIKIITTSIYLEAIILIHQIHSFTMHSSSNTAGTRDIAWRPRAWQSSPAPVSLRSLVLVAVVNQDVSWQLMFPCPSTCHTSFIIMFYVCIYYIMRWNYAIVVQNITNLRLWEWAEKCSVASRLGFETMEFLKEIPWRLSQDHATKCPWMKLWNIVVFDI